MIENLENMKKELSFKREILATQRANLHKPYFAQNQDLISIRVEIVTKSGGKLVPLRNKACKLPECIYDLEEILTRFREGGYARGLQFDCKFCEVSITLKSFIYDVTLSVEIDIIWDQYNSGQTPRVKEINQYKDGHCEIPKVAFTMKLDALEKRDITPGKNRAHSKNKTSMASQQAFDTSIGKNTPASNFPKLSEYTKNELSTLLYNFSSGNKKDTGKKVTPFGVEISKQEVDSILDNSISSSVMAFFTSYMRNYSKVYSPDKDDQIFAFIINSYEKYEQKVSVKYLDSSISFKNNGLGNLFLVYKYDERWIISIVDLKAKKCVIVDFLATDLSRTSKEEMQGLVKVLLNQEFQQKPGSLSFYDKGKSKTYSDCGLFVCRFLTSYIIDSISYNKISISEDEKNPFNMVLPWLILKTHFYATSKPKLNKTSPTQGDFEKILPAELNSQENSDYVTNLVKKEDQRASSLNVSLEPLRGLNKRNVRHKTSVVDGQDSSAQNTTALPTISTPFTKKKLAPIENLHSITQLNSSKIAEGTFINFNRDLKGSVEFGSSAFLSPEKMQRDVIAKRYGADILRYEFTALQMEGKLAHNVIVFFLGFLQERQDLRRSQGESGSDRKILSLGPQFYNQLTHNNLFQNLIDYEKVKGVTTIYNGQGNTIFDVFQNILLITKANPDNYELVNIDNVEKRIYLYSPTGKSEQSPINNPILSNISQYIEMEYNNKSQLTMNLAKWRFTYGEVNKVQTLRDSGLMVLKMIHSIYNGALETNSSREELVAFKKNLVYLIENIGVTENEKKDLAAFDKGFL